MEMIYCTQGDGMLEFEDGRLLNYTNGDMLVIPSGVMHMNTSKTGFKNIHIKIAATAAPYKSPFKITDAGGIIKQLLRQLTLAAASEMKNKNLIIQNYLELLLNLTAGMTDIEYCSEYVEKLKNKIIENFGDIYFDIAKYIITLPHNPDYIRKLFTKETGVSPLKYLTKIRLDNAKKLLDATDANRLKIKEISEMCGFSDALYFSRVFKKHYGVSPRDYHGSVYDSNTNM
jgi:AraC-like DNA-binding protein